MPAATPLAAHLAAALGPLPEPLQAVCGQGRRLALGKGEALLRAGEHWRHLWWVEHGCLRLHYLDRQGQSSNKNFYLDGAMLWPITPHLAHEPAAFWVKAFAPGHVWAVPWSAWQAAAAGHPPWQALERRVLASLLQDKMRREQRFLQRTATERYLDLAAEHPDWLRRIPLRHLATYLGVTDVALSRIRRRLV